jgi:hypothetical protein
MQPVLLRKRRRHDCDLDSEVANARYLSVYMAKETMPCNGDADSKRHIHEVHSALISIRNHDDIWENICSFLSGDALYRLSGVQFFKEPTCRSSAFICLSGLNNDAELVPWDDPDNVLSVHYVHHSVDSGFSMTPSFDRKMAAFDAANCAFKFLRYPMLRRSPRCSLSCVALQMCGPARPSSPVQSDCSIIPHFFKRVEHTMTVGFKSYPPVFGVRNGFSYPPFWDVLTGPINSECSDEE